MHAFVALIAIILNIGKMAHCTVMYTSLINQPKGLNITILWQDNLTMSKRQRKKSPVVGEEPEVEVVTKT